MIQDVFFFKMWKKHRRNCTENPQSIFLFLRFLQDIFQHRNRKSFRFGTKLNSSYGHRVQIYRVAWERERTLWVLVVFFSFLWTEVSLYQQHRLTSIWLFQTGTSSNKDYFFKRWILPDMPQKVPVWIFSNTNQTDQPTVPAVRDGHSFTQHGFIFWVVIISKAMEIKTPLKHPLTNDLTTEGLTRTEIFGLNVSGGGWKQSENSDYDSKQPFKL